MGTFADKACWYTILDGEGYTYVLFANGKEEGMTITAEVPGAFAAPLGDATVTFSEGSVTACLPPETTLAVKITDAPESGVYNGNIKLFHAGNGRVSAEEDVLLAVYQQWENAWELIGVYQDGDTIASINEGAYKVRMLHWDGLSPKEDAREWTN